ncbi:hypothetical protein GW17_00026010 [Ensete ventricosum]|nr:hypothetical protein GW17_00026010 [Ensete ventricosum]
MDGLTVRLHLGPAAFEPMPGDGGLGGWHRRLITEGPRDAFTDVRLGTDGSRRPNNMAPPHWSYLSYVESLLVHWFIGGFGGVEAFQGWGSDYGFVVAESRFHDVVGPLGRRFEDKEVQKDMKLVPYIIVNKDGKPYIQVKIKDGEVKVFSPEEISAMILTKMKETAEAFLGKKIKDAVVTVPGIKVFLHV